MKDRLENPIFIMKVLWVALLATLFVYAYLCESKFGRFQYDFFQHTNDTFFIIFALTGFLSFSWSFILPKALLRDRP